MMVRFDARMGRYFGHDPNIIIIYGNLLMCIKRFIQRIKQLFTGSAKGAKLSGTIKFFDRKKRFGFIVSNKHEYFFHAAGTRPEDFKSLQDGVQVRFNVVVGKKGPQADNIEIVK